MNYYRNDIRNVKGDTYSSALVIEGLGQSVNSIYFTCRETLNDNAEILFQSGLNDGISLVEYDEENDIRKYAVRISPIKTRNLQSGTYYYDLEVSVNSDVFTVMKGKFILEQDSTREDNTENTVILMVDAINGEVIGADIEDKLDYLEETKVLMKTMINDLGGDLTDTDTFRSYVDEMYNIYPKVIGEGTVFTLNNTKNAKMKLEIDSESAIVNVINKNLSLNDDLTNPDTNYSSSGGGSSAVQYSETEEGYYTTSHRQRIIDVKGFNTVSISMLAKLRSEGSSGNAVIIQAYNTTTGSSQSLTTYLPKANLTEEYVTVPKSYTIPSGFDALRLTFYNTLYWKDIQLEVGDMTTDYVEHQEQNITLPLSEGQSAYSYDDVTNIVSDNTVKATALMKGDE